MNEENSLLTGAVRPALLRYALPIILSMVATQFYAVADTMIIGLRLDADALAAVSNASTMLMIFLFVSGGMELGGGLLVAAGKPTATKHEMTELLYNLLFVDEVIALLTTAVGFVTLPALLRLINTPAEILEYRCALWAHLSAGAAISDALRSEQGVCHGLRRFQNAAQGHCGDQRDEHCA